MAPTVWGKIVRIKTSTGKIPTNEIPSPDSINLPNNNPITYRNYADNADINVLNLNTDNDIELGWYQNANLKIVAPVANVYGSVVSDSGGELTLNRDGGTFYTGDDTDLIGIYWFDAANYIAGTTIEVIFADYRTIKNNAGGFANIVCTNGIDIPVKPNDRVRFFRTDSALSLIHI
jgi:hypothetical protein